MASIIAAKTKSMGRVIVSRAAEYLQHFLKLRAILLANPYLMLDAIRLLITSAFV